MEWTWGEVGLFRSCNRWVFSFLEVWLSDGGKVVVQGPWSWRQQGCHGWILQRATVDQFQPSQEGQNDVFPYVECDG